MAHRALAVVTALVVLAPLLPTAGAQEEAARFSLAYTLTPGQDLTVTFQVVDPGPLTSVELALGDVRMLSGEPTLDGAWTWDGARAKVDLQASGTASATWSARANVLVESVEGEGYTSYVGERFAIIKPGDLLPGLAYSYIGAEPQLLSELTFSVPAGWTTAGPWPRTGDGFQLESLPPRGFFAAGAQLNEEAVGQGTAAYRVVRLEGVPLTEEAEQLFATAPTYLGGLYGTVPEHRFAVVAPEPMFQGGLGSPSGIFLHAKADGEVVAHELVHTYQAFQVSRQPGEAAVWLVEGTAVVHGALLEVAAGLSTRDEVLSRLEDTAARARDEHAVDLTTAVYGSGNELAAYTKGAVLVTVLNDEIRRATEDTYTLPDVLRALNAEAETTRPAPVLGTGDLVDRIADVTGWDLSDLFDRAVRGTDVPRLGSLFPGQAAVRILGTEPSEPIALEPLYVRVALINADVEALQVDVPVLVNGTVAGRVVASLGPGERGETRAALTPLPRGTYTLEVEGSEATVRVRAPAQPEVRLDIWPPEPTTRTQATVGLVVDNTGEATFNETLSVTLDGAPIANPEVVVPGGGGRTLPIELPTLGPGEHTVQVRTEGGVVLASTAFTLTEAGPLATPGAGWRMVVGAIAVIGALVARRR